MPESNIEVEFLSFIITTLTSDPNCFTIDRTVDDKGVFLHVTIDKAQAGRVIGREGKTATAIRQLLHGLGARNLTRYSMKIEDRE